LEQKPLENCEDLDFAEKIDRYIALAHLLELTEYNKIVELENIFIHTNQYMLGLSQLKIQKFVILFVIGI
jgi:hypothetical protein